MVAWRVEAFMDFTDTSGMGVWLHAEMAQRVAIGFDLHAGQPYAEHTDHEVLEDGSYRCRLFLANEADAEDAFAHVTDESLRAHLRAPTTERWSWVKMHPCEHDTVPPIPCPLPELFWSNQPGDEDPPDEPPVWVQPTGAHDAYALDDEVTHAGKVWRSTVNGNVWEPGVVGGVWVEVA